MNDIEFDFLSFILDKNQKNESFTQREVAKALKISLGMLNNIIKKAVNTGFVKISKINGKNYKYLLTPQGLSIIYNKSIKYFKNIVKNVYIYKDSILNLINRKKQQGLKKIVLLGKSNLDYIIEYCCIKAEIDYENLIIINEIEKLLQKCDKTNTSSKCAYFFSENLNEYEIKRIQNIISLINIGKGNREIENVNLIEFINTSFSSNKD